MKQIVTNNAGETQKFGAEFAKTLKPGDVIALYGDLGAGKTTFVQGVAKGLGIQRRIISPTFIIQRTYRLNHELSPSTQFYHLDLYRTEGLTDLEGLGLQELLGSEENIVIVEWAEKAKDILPKKRFDIRIEHDEKDKRKITLQKAEDDIQGIISNAIGVLKKGGIAIFPTDTAFGIGCRIDDEKAVKKLFQIRKRPETQATPVLVSSQEMAEKYLELIPKKVEEKLIQNYWPGALTIILPCKKEKVPELVRGKGKTLGVRMPNNETILEIIQGVGVPILGPSANFHGEKTPYAFEDLDAELMRLVDVVVPGECEVKQASTVIDCSVNPWKIVRQGAIKIQI